MGFTICGNRITGYQTVQASAFQLMTLTLSKIDNQPAIARFALLQLPKEP